MATTIKKPMTISQLTIDLSLNYKAIKDGKLDLNTAKELSSMAGKIISSAKVNLEYNKYMKKKTKIDFLEK